jgi:signal transduction histidine kinase
MKIRFGYFRLPLILLAIVAVFYFEFQNQLTIRFWQQMGYVTWQDFAVQHFLMLHKGTFAIFEAPFSDAESDLRALAKTGSDPEAFKHWLNHKGSQYPLVKTGFIWRRGVDTLEIIPVKSALDETSRNLLTAFISAQFDSSISGSVFDTLRYNASKRMGFDFYYADSLTGPGYWRKKLYSVKTAIGVIWDTEYYRKNLIPQIAEGISRKYKALDGESVQLRDGTVDGILLLDADGDTVYSFGKIKGFSEGLWLNSEVNLYDTRPIFRGSQKLPGWRLYVQDWLLSEHSVFSTFSKPENQPRLLTMLVNSILARKQILVPMRRQYLYLTMLMAFILAIIATEVYARKRQREFIARVSHELRTPVAKVRLFAETLRHDRVISPEKETEYLDIILRESDHLAVLVDNSLSYARLDSDRMKFNKTPLNLSEFLPEFFEGQRLYFEQCGFQYEVDIPNDLPIVKIDREALELALRNILDNAVKYSTSRKEIKVSATKKSGKVEISIEDQGPGVPQKECRKIFRPYYRLKRENAENIGGTGIGLSIVQKIVKGHGGKVQCEPRPEGGSSFILTLPVSK